MAKVPTDRWDEVRALFEAALDQAAADRDTWLDAQRADADVRDEVRSLLACHAQPHQLLDGAPAFQMMPPPDEALPAHHRIGAYRVERLLGRGGMGAVYLATRSDESFDLQVAIKVINQSLDGAEAVRRFLTERQTLAGLDHPNIARLFDGGTTEGRLPYFVMEYVDGQPIHEYCEQHHLDLAARLKLFLAVAAAVEHAHEHLVVHRDLKPDNILVRADGQPKLLDFGIAKVLAPTGAGGLTTVNAPAMTPRYASPEQVMGAPIGTPSDVYSLGVILYELLTGRLPHGEATDNSWQVVRAISEVQPAAPSNAARGTDAKSWAHRLPGDLDAIVLMALRKEPERRYRTVDQFAEDVRRYLDDRPVLARPDTLGYRTRKFVSRNRLASAAAIIAVVALTAGVVAATWQARVARAAATRALNEAARAQRVSEFLKTVIALPDPSWNAAGAGGRNDMTVLDLLKNAGDRIDRELGSDPEMAADLHHAIGNTYRARGLFNEAQPHFAKALELRQHVLPPNDPKVADSLFYFGANQFWLGHLDVAERYYERAIAIERTLPFEQAGQLPYMLLDLGTMPSYAADHARAERAIVEARDLFIRHLGPNHVTVAYALQRLALLQLDHDDLDAAERGLAEAAAIQEHQHSSPLDLSTIQEARGFVAMRRRDFATAERLFRSGLDARRDAYGADATMTVAIQLQLASAMTEQGRLREARSMTRDAIARLKHNPSSNALLAGALLLDATIGVRLKDDVGAAASEAAEARRIIDGFPLAEQCGAGQNHSSLASWYVLADRRADAALAFQQAVSEVTASCSHDSVRYLDVVKAAADFQRQSGSR